MERFMQRLIDFYETLEDYLSGGLIFLGLSLVMVNVVLRYVTGKPESILDEYSVYMIVWGAMIGFAVALRDDHHIKVDMLYRLLPLWLKRIVTVFAHLVGLTFAGAMTIFGTKLVMTYKLLGQGSADSQTPLWIVSLVLPLSGIMLAIRYLDKLHDVFKNGGRDWALAEEGGRGHDGNDNHHSAL